MSKIKYMSPVLLEMIITDIIYLVLGELFIIILLPNKLFYSIGFLVGVVVSIFAAIHMKLTVEQSLHHLDKSAIKRSIFAYMIRLFTIAVIFYAMYVFQIGDLLAGLIGMFALKLSAYLQPFIHKVIEKDSKFKLK